MHAASARRAAAPLADSDPHQIQAAAGRLRRGACAGSRTDNGDMDIAITITIVITCGGLAFFAIGLRNLYKALDKELKEL